MSFAQAARRAEQLFGLGLQAEEPPGQDQQFVPKRGGKDLSTPAIEQANAIGRFQRLDLAGKRWLGHMQTVGCLGEAALAGHRVEGAKLVMIHR